MRELNVSEIVCVSGGMQATGEGSGSPQLSWWERFCEAAQHWWDGAWGGGGGGPLTQSDIQDYCTIVGGAEIVAGRYASGGGYMDICDSATQTLQNHINQQKQDICDQSGICDP